MSRVRLRAISRTAANSSSNSATMLLLPERIFSASAIFPRDCEFATLTSERIVRDILDASIHASAIESTPKTVPANTILSVSISVCCAKSALPARNSRSSIITPISQFHGL